MARFNFDYDHENDDLFIYSKLAKSHSSVEIDDMILDFDSKGNFAGLEMINAMKFFKYLDAGVDKAFLKGLKKCNIDVIKKGNFLMLKLLLVSKKKGEVTAPLLIPTIKKPSPSLAF